MLRRVRLSVSTGIVSFLGASAPAFAVSPPGPPGVDCPPLVVPCPTPGPRVVVEVPPPQITFKQAPPTCVTAPAAPRCNPSLQCYPFSFPGPAVAVQSHGFYAPQPQMGFAPQPQMGFAPQPQMMVAQPQMGFAAPQQMMMVAQPQMAVAPQMGFAVGGIPQMGLVPGQAMGFVHGGGVPMAGVGPQMQMGFPTAGHAGFGFAGAGAGASIPFAASGLGSSSDDLDAYAAAQKAFIETSHRKEETALNERLSAHRRVGERLGISPQSKGADGKSAFGTGPNTQDIPTQIAQIRKELAVLREAVQTHNAILQQLHPQIPAPANPPGNPLAPAPKPGGN